MILRGWLLAGFVLSALAHLVGVASISPLMPGAEMLAWALLAAYVTVGGGIRLPAVRLLLAGLLALLLVAVWAWATRPEPTASFGFFVYRDSLPEPSVSDAVVGGLRVSWLPVLAAVLLVAAAAVATRTGPAHPPAAPTPVAPPGAPAVLVSAVGAALAVGYYSAAVAAWARSTGAYGPIHLIAAALPALLVALAAVAVAGRLLDGPPGPRPATKPLLVAGLSLTMLAVLAFADAVMGQSWSNLYFDYESPGPRPDAMSTALLPVNVPVRDALWFAGAALLALGCPTGRRTQVPAAMGTGKA
ncbi:hypothetical protein [Polymorphospora rubra]|uniref:Uncharacterized protein n=1 Tax=Polymorphospora rubra TaxID=338584 RepID=A0A810N251_9ACTN|nr:hypothetical protein [Polymorphospora rubra]BCJ67522.1 hypothetical protein Prubr_45430 [Polymorphospora rubra]